MYVSGQAREHHVALAVLQLITRLGAHTGESPFAIFAEDENGAVTNRLREVEGLPRPPKKKKKKKKSKNKKSGNDDSDSQVPSEEGQITTDARHPLLRLLAKYGLSKKVLTVNLADKAQLEAVVSQAEAELRSALAVERNTWDALSGAQRRDALNAWIRDQTL